MPDSAIFIDTRLDALAGSNLHPGADQMHDRRFAATAELGIVVALIDSVHFSRDCLIQALRVQSPELALVPFTTIRECISDAPAGLRMILYYAHQDSSLQAAVLQSINELRQAFAETPIVVLSDASVAFQPSSIRAAISSGAQGYIPTANTAMTAAIAAIRLVKDGGTIAPVDVLLSKNTEVMPSSEESQSTLTPRQMMVLSHLRQGKANKIIAYELGMSESTVKLHVRNIMRRMGATNRTQAVYKSQQVLATAAITG
jgi:DNA-binding NarL/FixJ family response regulator